MSFFSRAADTVYAFRFLKLLTTPWKETNAFKLGLIDGRGNKLRTPTTDAEKSVYTYFNRLVFNVKRIMGMVSFGSSRIASYAAALYLIKEHTQLSEEAILKVLSEATYDLTDSSTKQHQSVILAETFDMIDLALCESTDRTIIDVKQIGSFAGVPVYEGTLLNLQHRVIFSERTIAR
jgi:hypothetical protein